MIDEQQITNLHELHKPVYRYVLKLSHDEELAQRITGDAFAAVVEKLNESTINNVRSYLFQTAYHMLINDARDKSRFAPLEVVMDNVDEVPALALETDLQELLPWIKDQLSIRQYECFELCVLKGYSLEQAGEILNIQPNNVKASLNRARKNLRVAYESGVFELKPKKKLVFLKHAFTNNRVLRSKYARGNCFDWQLSEQEFLVAFGYPRNMTEPAEKFFREYHRELVLMAQGKGLLDET